MKRASLRWALPLVLMAVLAAPVAASTWSLKCAESRGYCMCCVLAYLDAAFAALGGW